MIKTKPLAELKADHALPWRGLPIGSHERAMARFFPNVRQSGECWHWTAGKDRKGYGKFMHNGKNMLAHRVSYELLAESIPAGLVIDHLCRNPPCVNPAHLEPVTQRENDRRAQPHRFRFCIHSELGTTAKCAECKSKYIRLRSLYTQIGRDLIERGAVRPAFIEEARQLRSSFPTA